MKKFSIIKENYEHKIPKTLYHGSLNKFEKFNDNVEIFFSDNIEFATTYARNKSADMGLDRDVIIYKVEVNPALKIFNISDKEAADKLYMNLDDSVHVSVNNFGFTEKLDKDVLFGLLNGIKFTKEVEELKDKKYGDILIFQDEYADENEYDLFFCLGNDGKDAYVYKIGEEIGANTQFRFKIDRSELHNDENYIPEDNGKAMNMIFRALTDSKHRLYGYLQSNLSEFINKQKNHPWDLKIKYPISRYEYEVKDTWRWYENDDVHNALIESGFDGYTALEKGKITYCLFPDVNKKVTIIKD